MKGGNFPIQGQKEREGVRQRERGQEARKKERKERKLIHLK